MGMLEQRRSQHAKTTGACWLITRNSHILTMVGLRAGRPVASVRERSESLTTPARSRWMAGSRPAMAMKAKSKRGRVGGRGARGGWG
jgi:hypothetical protein